jgi:hypothetical protein
MSINLLEKVQENLGYPALQKIDPNTQQVVAGENTPAEDKFSQAAIPAVLTALYKYVQSDEGAAALLLDDNSSKWVGKIFDDTKKEAIQTIAAYASRSNAETIIKMNEIANEAVKLVKENLPANAAIKEVKLFFSNQKNNILLYLPAALNMGELLHDNTLDDNTNKMKGPISSLIQNIGGMFSNPVTGEEIKPT